MKVLVAPPTPPGSKDLVKKVAASPETEGQVKQANRGGQNLSTGGVGQPAPTAGSGGKTGQGSARRALGFTRQGHP